MSDTPRTDAAVFAFDQNYLKVNADFARQLERELAALRAQLATRETERNQALKVARAAQAELFKYRDANDGVFVESLKARLAERDAEIKALKGHAEAMYEEMQLQEPDYRVSHAYRAAYPKE